MYKAGQKLESSFSHSFLAVFLSLVMQRISSFLFYAGLFFKMNAHAFLVYFNWVPYIQTSDMIPGVNTMGGKVREVSDNKAGGLGCSRTPTVVLGGTAP